MNSMREAAMEKAIELHKGTGVSAEELVATAEAILSYCTGELHSLAPATDNTFPPFHQKA